MITIKQDKPRTCPYCGSDDIELIVMSFDKDDTIMQLYIYNVKNVRRHSWFIMR